MDRRVVVSGCSSGGKSTLLTELARRGHAVVEEPGRRVVTGELASGGSALPWIDLEAFAREAMALARADLAAAPRGLVFFDRGLIDAVTALDHACENTRPPASHLASAYDPTVFMAPPWRAIFVNDPHRRQDFDEAAAEYDRLVVAYTGLGYEVVDLPRARIADRVEFMLDVLD